MPLPRRRKHSRIWPLAVLLLLLLVSIWLGWKGWRTYTLAQALRSDVQALQQHASSTPDAETLPALQALAGSARTHAAALRDETHLFLPLTRHMGWVPTYGSDLVAAEPLLTVAVQTTTAVDESLDALRPLATMVTTTPTLSETQTILAHLSAVRPQLEQAQGATTQALAAWQAIPQAELSPRLSRYTQRIEPLLLLLDAGLHLTLAVDEVATPLLPIAIEVQHTRTVSTTLIQPLQQARPALERARPAITQTTAAWERIPIEDMPRALRPRLQQMTTLVPLLQASVELAAAADETMAVLAPLIQEHSEASSSNLHVLEHLDKSQQQLAQAQAAVVQAHEHWSRLALQDMPPSLRSRLQPLPGILREARDGLGLALVLPALLGLEAPQTYVFIAQNPDELRASGGFISAVGELTFRQGELEDFWVDNTDAFVPGEYPAPPEPFQRYMDISLWVFRDANWSPDFPTAAERLRSLYEIERGSPPANIIAFTPTAIQYVLEATGPVDVEDVADPTQTTPVSAASLQQYIQDQYNASEEQNIHRKAFLEPLMEALIARLQSDTADIDTLALGRAMLRALNERHLLIVVENAEVTTTLAQHKWNGAVQPGTGDFLMAVDSNMGYTKANFYIQQAITYTVDLRNPTAPEAELRIRHTHTFPEAYQCQRLRDREPRQPGLSRYADHTRRCYWNYLRVLVPAGSQVTRMHMQPVPAAWNLSDLDDGTAAVSRGTADTDMISTFLMVPPGNSRETVFRYRLPPDVLQPTAQGWYYQLAIQKQAGREALPVVVQVLLPSGASVVQAGPPVGDQNQQRVTWTAELATDHMFDITFALAQASAALPAQQPQGTTP